jgi:hypothetical protein
MGTVLSYSLSTGLGFAGTAEAYTNDGGKNLLQGYRSAMYLGIGMSGLVTVHALVFVRIPKDVREGGMRMMLLLRIEASPTTANQLRIIVGKYIIPFIFSLKLYKASSCKYGNIFCLKTRVETWLIIWKKGGGFSESFGLVAALNLRVSELIP